MNFLDFTERRKVEQDLEKYQTHLQELVEERTGELRQTISLMAGREVRMAELKETIKKLRGQIDEAGMVPVADDPLRKAES